MFSYLELKFVACNIEACPLCGIVILFGGNAQAVFQNSGNILQVKCKMILGVR